MKQNVSETGSNWRFRKNVKTCLQKKKFYLMSHSRHGHFHPILILHLKIVKLPQQHASNTVHYQVAKSSILNEAEFWDPSLKTSPCTKTSQVSCENQLFFLLFRNVAIFIESHCVFLLLFTVWCILDGCYYYLLFMDPVNGFSKSKLLVK